MKAILRFALHTLLPPLGGGGLIVGAFVITSIGRIPPIEIFQGVFVGLFFAYVVASIPSLIYAVVMEFASRRGITPGSRRALWLSAGIGGTVGALLIVAPSRRMDWPAVILMSLVGLVVGLAVEWLIGQIAREFAPQKSREP